MLTPEARHLIKIADLNALEQFARQASDQIEIASIFEDVFVALDQRTQLAPEIALDWGERYITWAKSFPDRDGLPFLGTAWARRLIERATAADRRDLALEVAEAMLDSYAPLEKERPWWQKQRYYLTAKPNA
jgi:hypothetical protein